MAVELRVDVDNTDVGELVLVLVASDDIRVEDRVEDCVDNVVVVSATAVVASVTASSCRRKKICNCRVA
jgi:hypothetical protein